MGSRIANLATKLNSRHRDLQLVRVRQRIGLDLDGVMRVGSRQPDAPATRRPYNTSEQCPGMRRGTKSGGCLGGTERDFRLGDLQIGSIEAGITLPEEGGL